MKASASLLLVQCAEALEAATGRKPRWSHVERLAAYLKARGLGVTDVRLENHPDLSWSQRSTRTEAERDAALIARKQSPRAEAWWAVPHD